jgi:hypothetical protein
MIFTTELPFIREFIDQLDQGLQADSLKRKLSNRRLF